MSTSSAAWKREFHNDPKSAYVLPADEEERERLLFQHKLIVDTVFDGALLEDSIKLEPGQSVLESGTGSGLWTLELASQAPSVTFHGIDISTRLFPPNPPSNTTFSENSILDLPKDWAGRFDLINQRLLISSLRGPEWRQAISGMFTALKPGGYVQLVECTQNTSVGPVTERLCTLLNAVYESRGLSTTCAENIPGWLEEAGFVDIKVDKRFVKLGATAGERGEVWMQSFMNFMRACKPVIYETKGLKWNGPDYDQEFDEMVASARKEWDESTESGQLWVCVTAKKSL